MPTTDLKLRLCALVLISVGCGSSPSLDVQASCPEPGGPPADADSGAPDAGGGAPDAGGAPQGLPAGWTEVVVAGGLLADLDAAAGTSSLGDRSIGDHLRVLAGYGVDYVYLDHVGSLMPPPDMPGQAPSVVTLRGNPRYVDDPQRPPEDVTARALFQVLVNGPHTGDAQSGSRDSPGGRVHCDVGQGALAAAGCLITGAWEVRF
jgi:hypothetical protein